MRAFSYPRSPNTANVIGALRKRGIKRKGETRKEEKEKEEKEEKEGTWGRG